MTKRLKELPTSREVIQALGGEESVADVTGVTAKAVNNWANWNKIPAEYYGRMLWDLNKLGYTAPPRLWRQVGCEGLRIRRITK